MSQTTITHHFDAKSYGEQIGLGLITYLTVSTHGGAARCSSQRRCGAKQDVIGKGDQRWTRETLQLSSYGSVLENTMVFGYREERGMMLVGDIDSSVSKKSVVVDCRPNESRGGFDRGTGGYADVLTL